MPRRTLPLDAHTVSLVDGKPWCVACGAPVVKFDVVWGTKAGSRATKENSRWATTPAQAAEFLEELDVSTHKEIIVTRSADQSL